MSATAYDVAIVGAGDVGCAIARELARFDLRVVLLEAGGDVGAGTSKANTAILHTGFDAKPGSLEARLVARGHALMLAYAEEVGVPLERTGALLIAWDEQQLARLPEIRENAARCGYARVGELSREELYRREPRLGAGAQGALTVPDEFIVCPWTPPLAWATQAVRAGVELRRRQRVTGLLREEDAWTLVTERGRLRAEWVVNAAGLYSDEVHRLAGRDGFTITPRRGELLVFDKLSRPLVNHILLPVPTPTTKGVLIAPTVFGNVLLGPTAVDIEDKEDVASTAAGIDQLLAAGQRLMPALMELEVTSTYVGLRAASDRSDYIVEVDDAAKYACAAGIRSTGLTSSLAIAELICEELGSAGLGLSGGRPLPALRMPNIGEALPRPYAEPGRIGADPAYGETVCFCERVTRGEVRDALASEIPPLDLGGLRRRTRAMMGRCQGFHCGAALAEMAAAPGPQRGEAEG
jgi:glycerol-3-phosphate dehydrogenase